LGVSVTDARGGGGAFGSPGFVAAPGVGRPTPLTEGSGARAGGGCGALRSAVGSLLALDGMGARAGGSAAATAGPKGLVCRPVAVAATPEARGSVVGVGAG
jgi:hypothetical protein